MSICESTADDAEAKFGRNVLYGVGESGEEQEEIVDNLVEKKKWKRCSRCGVIIGRIAGCKNMFYRYQTQFCVVERLVWSISVRNVGFGTGEYILVFQCG